MPDTHPGGGWINLCGNHRGGLMGIDHLQQRTRFQFDRERLRKWIGFVKGRMGDIPQSEHSPIATGRNVNVNARFLRCGLIELGEAFSDFCHSESHDRVFSGLVVGPPTEYLRTDYALTQEMVRPDKAMLDDVAEQALTLLRVTKRRARQHLIQGAMDPGRISQPGFLRILRWEDRVGLATHV
jgi:hypothetical protein